tara:strand:+ start:128 stop:256 length:129 start_codon:yes stop_codon:yes gene_type:complete
MVSTAQSDNDQRHQHWDKKYMNGITPTVANRSEEPLQHSQPM